jgi:hypothetical protein
MKMKGIGLAVLFGLAGCHGATDADRIENSIRENLANQGTVEDVNMVSQDENSLNGYAEIRTASGQRSRLNCDARRNARGDFSWHCLQPVDAALLGQVEGWIRDRFREAGMDVIDIDLSRAGDDNNIAGYARVRDGTGGETRARCRAVRDAPDSNLFSFRCGEIADSWAAARPLGNPRAGGGK